MKKLVMVLLSMVAVNAFAWCDNNDYACRQAEASERAARAQQEAANNQQMNATALWNSR